MNEVTRSFPCYLTVIIGGICVYSVRNSRCTIVIIQISQDGVGIIRIATYTMLILGIDIATAHTCLHINQVEFYDTGDIAPVFLIESFAGTLL